MAGYSYEYVVSHLMRDRVRDPKVPLEGILETPQAVSHNHWIEINHSIFVVARVIHRNGNVPLLLLDLGSGEAVFGKSKD